MSEFDFDYTGEDPLFKVENEIQSAQAVGSQEYHLIIPGQSPFFWESLVVEFYSGGVYAPLEKGVDYTPGHLFTQATRQTAKAIYGSFVITNRALSGPIKLSYQKLGGSWQLDINKINQILSDKAVNPRRTTWEEVTGYPEQFPVIPHVHIDEEDMTTMADVVVEISRLADAVEDIVGNTRRTVWEHIALSDSDSPIDDVGFKDAWNNYLGILTLSRINLSLNRPQLSGDNLKVDIEMNGDSIINAVGGISFVNNNNLAFADTFITEEIPYGARLEVIITSVASGLSDPSEYAAGLKLYITGTTTNINP